VNLQPTNDNNYRSIFLIKLILRKKNYQYILFLDFLNHRFNDAGTHYVKTYLVY